MTAVLDRPATGVTVYYTEDYTPSSSVLDDILYDGATATLIVSFNNDPDTYYVYKGVPYSVWDGFRKAQSAGSFYASNIKGHYPCDGTFDYTTADLVYRGAADNVAKAVDPVVAAVATLDKYTVAPDPAKNYGAFLRVEIPLTSKTPVDLATEFAQIVESLNYAGWAYTITDLLVAPGAGKN